MPERERVRLPGATDRTAILGTTGSGKTVGALAHLSVRNFTTIPWMAYDPSGDPNLEKITRAKHVGLDFIPKNREKGLFVVEFRPSETDALEEHMAKMFERGNAGIYVDEGFLGSCPSLFDILVAGRKRNMPVIFLAQAPVEKQGAPVRTVLRNIEFVQVFELPVASDWDRIEEIIPPLASDDAMESALEHTRKRFCSIYFDRKERRLSQLAPVPEPKILLERIDRKLRPKRKRL